MRCICKGFRDGGDMLIGLSSSVYGLPNQCMCMVVNVWELIYSLGAWEDQ